MNGNRQAPSIRPRTRPVVAHAATLAVAAASLALSASTAAPTIRQLATADGRRFLHDAPTDTVTVSIVHLGLVVVSGAATALLGALLLTELVARRPRGRLARWTPAPIRHAAGRLARVGLAAGTLLAVTTSPPRPAGATPGGGSTSADDVAPTIAVMTALGSESRPPIEHATMAWLGQADPEPAATPTVTPAAAHTPVEPPTTFDPATDATWVVGPGDSFWSIAEETLTEAGDSPPSDAAIGDYWQRLLHANRDRLAVAETADLLWAGQVLVLPPVP